MGIRCRQVAATLCVQWCTSQEMCNRLAVVPTNAMSGVIVMQSMCKFYGPSVLFETLNVFVSSNKSGGQVRNTPNGPIIGRRLLVRV